MKLKQIILEYDRSKTVSRLFDKLVSASKAQGTFYRTLKSAYERQNQELTDSELADSVMQFLEDADPTANKQYTQWLAGQYVNRKFRIEDVDRVKGVLENFIKFRAAIKRTGKSVDINQYDYPALHDLIDEITKVDSTQVVRKNYQHENEMKFLSRSALGELAVPLTQRASCELGRGTRWCTAADKNNYFDDYNDSGPLYVWTDEKGKKYQFWFNTRLEDGFYIDEALWQFMDASDRPIDKIDPAKFKHFVYENPVTSKIFRKFEQYMLSADLDDSSDKRDLLQIYAKEVLQAPWPQSIQEQYPEAAPLDKYLLAVDEEVAFDYIIRYADRINLRYQYAELNNNRIEVDYFDLDGFARVFAGYQPVKVLHDLIIKKPEPGMIPIIADKLSKLNYDATSLVFDRLPSLEEFIDDLPVDIQLSLEKYKKKNQTLKDLIDSKKKLQDLINNSIYMGAAVSTDKNAEKMLLDTYLSTKNKYGIGKFEFYEYQPDMFELEVHYYLSISDFAELYNFFQRDEELMQRMLTTDRVAEDLFFDVKSLTFIEPDLTKLVSYDDRAAHDYLRTAILKMEEIADKKRQARTAKK